MEFCPVCGQPDNCGDCNHLPAGPVYRYKGQQVTPLGYHDDDNYLMFRDDTTNVIFFVPTLEVLNG